jgi:hypothetical protein
MNTQVSIDETLMEEARVVAHLASHEDTVIAALREFIQNHKRTQIMANRSGVVFGLLQGKFSVPDDFDNALPKAIENEFYEPDL